MDIENLELLELYCDEALDHLALFKRICLDLSRGEKNSSPNNLFRATHSLKGGARAVGQQSLSEFVHQLETYLRLLGIEKRSLSSKTILQLLSVHDFLKTWFESLSRDPLHKPDPKQLKSWLNLLKIPANGEKKHVKSSSAMPLRGIEVLEEKAAKTYLLHTDEQLKLESEILPNRIDIVRLATAKIDDIFRELNQLSFHTSNIIKNLDHAQFPEHVVEKVALRAIVERLHFEFISLRREKILHTFQNLKRMTLEIGHAQKKQIQVETVGDTLDVDKHILEKSAEAILHLLRNAVDHGISHAKTDKVSKITISCKRDNLGNLFFSVQDNGQGLNIEKILSKARKLKILKETESINLTEIQNLIFHPGFSTRSSVTDISGFGIGLSVAKDIVEKLGGKLTVWSKPNKGTKFEMVFREQRKFQEVLLFSFRNKLIAVDAENMIEISEIGETKNILFFGPKERLKNAKSMDLEIPKSLGKELGNEESKCRATFFHEGEVFSLNFSQYLLRSAVETTKISQRNSQDFLSEIVLAENSKNTLFFLDTKRLFSEFKNKVKPKSA